MIASWRSLRRVVLVSVGLLLAFSGTAVAQLTIQHQPQLPTDSVNTDIVALVADPSDASRQFVATGGGKVYVRVGTAFNATPFLDITSLVFNGSSCPKEGSWPVRTCYGLLAIAPAPDYGTSGRFYVLFTNLYGDYVVSRFKRSASNPQQVDPSTRFDLRWPHGYRIIGQPTQARNPGQLAFGPDGYLYIALGDGIPAGSPGFPAGWAQHPYALLGKILRVDVNVSDADAQGYRVPADNPFVDNRPIAALHEIWAFGIHAPTGMTFDSPALGGTGALVFSDKSEYLDEINYEPAGRGGGNYGWPRVGSSFSRPNEWVAYGPLIEPLLRADVHSIEGGERTFDKWVLGAVYRGSALSSHFRGQLIFGARLPSSWTHLLALELTIDPVTGEPSDTALQIAHGFSATNSPFFAAAGTDAAGEIFFSMVNTTREWEPGLQKVINDPTFSGYSARAAPVRTDGTVLGGTVYGPGLRCGTLGDGQDLGCSTTVTAGWTISLEAQPDPGYRFVKWIGSRDCRDGELTMNGDRICYAIFEKAPPNPRLPTVPRGRTTADFNGDGRAELAFLHQGAWHFRSTTDSPNPYYSFGSPLAVDPRDRPVPADYDGDGIMDLALFRPYSGRWVIRYSRSGSSYEVTWGISTDQPVPADYDGDGKADVAVFRPDEGLWSITHSGGTGVTPAFGSGSHRFLHWGISSDIPVPGDYDGDGRADIAVFRARDGLWSIALSSGNYQTYRFFHWGIFSDLAVPADYNGDGTTDIAIYRPDEGRWFIAIFAGEQWVDWRSVQWGISSDLPVPRDFDGDGLADIAVYRRSELRWLILYSSGAGFVNQVFGVDANDVIIPTRPRGWWEDF